MTNLPYFGIDYAWGRPSILVMKEYKVKFVCRYLSHNTSGKNLTRREAEQLTRANIPIVVVWESTAKRMRAGLQAGKDDAKTAAKQALDCGMPNDRPIYFGCDFDATEHDQTAINAYLKGAASVIGLRRVGIYAGYYVVSRCINAGLVKWAWQTYAWSGGHLHKAAQLYQYSNGHNLDGVSVDYNKAFSKDYGQWYVGKTQPMEKDMEPTTKVTVPEFWMKQKQFSKSEYPADHFWIGSLSETRKFGNLILAELKAQRALNEKLLEMVGQGLPDLAEFKAAMQQAAKEAVDSIEIHVDTENDEENTHVDLLKNLKKSLNATIGTKE